MLNETLDLLMGKATEHEMLTRAAKFSSMFKNIARDNSFREDFMNEKLGQYIKQDKNVSSAIQEVVYADASELIVEDPEQLKFEVEFKKDNSGTPFFRSLHTKLFTEAAA